MRSRRPASSARTWFVCRRLRFRLVAFLVRMWLRLAWPALYLPEAVFRKRLAAPRFVFSFGIDVSSAISYRLRGAMTMTICRPSSCGCCSRSRWCRTSKSCRRACCRAKPSSNASRNYDRQQLLYDQQRNTVNVDLQNALINYENAKRILLIEEETIGLAKENVFIALESFKRGVNTFIELRTAQQSLAEAYNRLITARYNAKLAETELLRLNGSLLQ